MREAQEARRDRDLLGYETAPNMPREASRPDVDDEDQESTAHPIIQLSNLPPGMVEKDVEDLLRDHVKVERVDLTGPAASASGGRKSKSALAILPSDLPTGKIDTLVGALRDKYLGYGFYLNITRNLSSTGLHPTVLGNGPKSAVDMLKCESTI